MDLHGPYPSAQLNAAGVCIGISESPAALSDDIYLPPIDERCGITNKARDQPPSPFLDTISPRFGYYCADGEASKAAVFLRSDFHREIESISLQRRVACEPEDDVGIPVPRGNCPKPRDGFSGPPIHPATRLPPRVPRKRGQSLRFIT